MISKMENWRYLGLINNYGIIYLHSNYQGVAKLPAYIPIFLLHIILKIVIKVVIAHVL
jgi:hypothetical protein